MGYSEVYCQICGVSFNIRRFRTIGEPRSAAWGDDEDFAHIYNVTSECSKNSCVLLKREPDHPELEHLISCREFLKTGQQLDLYDNRWEHIAGPECGLFRAYNGHRISVEAMKGCRVFQCLVRKASDWQPEPDDELFEVSGDFFLSGLSDQMRSRDMGQQLAVFPARHRESRPRPDNCVWVDEMAENYAMPFHPTCLEIFKRASLYRYGVVDINCLIRWWELEATWDEFYEFPRHRTVKGGQQQWWEHTKGDEFLAANPCFVPGLESVLDSTQRSRETHQEDSETMSTAVSQTPVPSDSLSRLPSEIKILILSQLSFNDIANLRLTSRVFLRLPNSLFHHLILRDMPWLYEAWSPLPISFWATTTPSELKSQAEIMNNPLPKAPVTLLSRAETDWFHLKCEVSRNWQKLLGLQNRRRVWDDCQEILNRVDKYREQGKIKTADAVV
ncbi:hypothetical protein ACKAV7_008376 [Fusarium commune]